MTLASLGRDFSADQAGEEERRRGPNTGARYR